MQMTARERVNAAFDAMQLEKFRAQTQSNLRLVKKTQDGTLGDVEHAGDDNDPEALGMGGINIGDTHHNYPAQQQSTGGKLLPALLTAAGIAMGGTGIGAGLALPAILNKLTPAATPAQPAPVIPDFQDSFIDFGLAK